MDDETLSDEDLGIFDRVMMTRRWAVEQAQIMVDDNPTRNEPGEVLYIADRFAAFVLTGETTDDEDAA